MQILTIYQAQTDVDFRLSVGSSVSTSPPVLLVSGLLVGGDYSPTGPSSVNLSESED